MDDHTMWMAQLRKGVVELLVLQLLSSAGPLHGYGIVRELREHGDVIAGESTVYPVLKRLEADGLVHSEWAPSAGGPPRKYYRITDSGTDALERGRANWFALVDVMNALRGDDR